MENSLRLRFHSLGSRSQRYLSGLVKNYEIIEHTADIGIRVKGASLDRIFKNAALALFDMMADKHTSARSRRRVIRIKQTADTLEELFINWLNELISLSQTKEVIFTDFKINALDARTIEARGIAGDIADYYVHTEVKAATYHQLMLTKNRNGWQAEVIFDV